MGGDRMKYRGGQATIDVRVGRAANQRRRGIQIIFVARDASIYLKIHK